MDSVHIDKLQAIKESRNKKQLLLPRLIKLVLSVSSLAIFLSSPHWLPSAISILEAVQAVAFVPKGLFIICNIIIVVLIGESKLSKSSTMSDKRFNDEAEKEIEEETYEEVEELNKRVEAFIERVNKQRKLEAKLIDCCSSRRR